MKKILSLLLVILFVSVLSSCDQSVDPEILKSNVIDLIDFYVEANEYIDTLNSAGLDDVEESLSYNHQDFFNYDLKATNNVELEYDEYFDAFRQLRFAKTALENIEGFIYGKYYNDVLTSETLYIDFEDGVLNIEYFEHLDELEVITRHSYFLRTEGDEVNMDKYLEIYDCDQGESLVIKKMSVYGDRYVESWDYYPETNSFQYIYNSKEEQEFFKYKGTLNNETFLRQTVEYYIPTHSAYVSYDIKDDELEDYRVKIFNKGHRVVKIDVNVKNSNPTVNELTWNLLSIPGWSTIEQLQDIHYVYRGSYSTMQGYDISVQLNGYGKVIAYKMFEGELSPDIVSLLEYGLNSGITLNQANLAKDAFIANYITEATKYGFTINEVENRIIIQNVVNPSNLVKAKFAEYINNNK